MNRKDQREFSRTKWLVIGSAGYLGAELSSLLLHHNMQVYGIDIQSPIADPGFETASVNLEDLTTVKSIFDSFQPYGVINCAAKKSVTESFLRPKEYRFINTDLNTALFKIAAACEVQQFHFVSSASVYRESDSPITEIDETCPTSPYADSKLKAEFELEELTENYQGQIYSWRPFNIVGKNMHSNSGTSVLSQIYNAAINRDTFKLNYFIDNGEKRYPIRDYVHVRDVAQGILNGIFKCQNTGKLEIVNLSSSIGTPLDTLISLFIEITNLELRITENLMSLDEIRKSVGDNKKVSELYGWRISKTILDAISEY